MTTDNDFLPEGYDVPAGNGNYMKFEKGTNEFRIMSKPIMGWLDWTTDKKPVRFKMDNKPNAPIDPAKKVKHFWACIVWNVKAEAIQLLEITQSSVQTAIKGLATDKDWGAPFSYNLKVIRSGDGMDTEYQTNPAPHKPMTEEMMNAFNTKPIQLDLLFSGDDPFSPKGAPTPLESPLPF